MAITDGSASRSQLNPQTHVYRTHSHNHAHQTTPAGSTPAATTAQPVSQLRQQSSSTPEGDAGKAALTEQAAVAARARGMSPQNRVNEELKTRGLEAQLGRLTPAQREQFNRLATGLVPPGNLPDIHKPGQRTPEELKLLQQAARSEMARNNLMSLLQNGKLTSTDSQGKTLLANLDSISRTQFPGKDSQEVLKSTLSMMPPTNPLGGAPVTSTQAAAQANPAELARVTRELTRNGKATLANGDQLTKPPAPPPTPVLGGFGGMFGNVDPTSSAVEGALSHYGRQQAKSPEQAAGFQSAVEAQLKANPRAAQAYQRLTPEQQARTRALSTAQGADARFAVSSAFGSQTRPPLNADLTRLLADGKLTGRDSQGDTLLNNLHQLRPAGENPDFSREILYGQTVQRLAHPERQKTWTTAQQDRMLSQQPAEYVRVVDGLSSGQRKVTLGDGTVLDNHSAQQVFFHPDPDTIIKGAAIKGAIQSGRPVAMVNSEGQPFQATFANDGVNGQNGQQRFHLTVDGHRVDVSADSSIQGAGERLGSVADGLSLTPRHLRGELKQIHYNAGPNPSDPYWEKEYKMPGFQSLATAGQGRIQVWNGSNLAGESFDHEMGHLIGARRGFLDKLWDRYNQTHDPDNIPVGWQSTSGRDKKDMSHYGTRSPAEDFAESWAHYMEARRAGPQQLAQFQKDYPARAATLERIYNGGTW